MREHLSILNWPLCILRKEETKEGGGKTNAIKVSPLVLYQQVLCLKALVAPLTTSLRKQVFSYQRTLHGLLECDGFFHVLARVMHAPTKLHCLFIWIKQHIRLNCL